MEMQIVTNELRLKRKGNGAGVFKFDPVIQKRVGQVTESRRFCEFTVTVDNKRDADFPIDVFISVAGYFTFGREELPGADAFMLGKAPELVYPYIRTILSGAMGAALMNPLTLPLIDVTK